MTHFCHGCLSQYLAGQKQDKHFYRVMNGVIYPYKDGHLTQ
jgi:hypothetical protein